MIAEFSLKNTDFIVTFKTSRRRLWQNYRESIGMYLFYLNVNFKMSRNGKYFSKKKRNQKAMLFTLNVIFEGCSLEEMRNWCQVFVTMLTGYLFLGFFEIFQIYLDAFQMRSK